MPWQSPIPCNYGNVKRRMLHCQGEAIAVNLREMFGIRVPILSVVIGEGGSGGALAIGCCNYTFIMEHSVYYVASPEACAAILWKSREKSKTVRCLYHVMCHIGRYPHPLDSSLPFKPLSGLSNSLCPVIDCHRKRFGKSCHVDDACSSAILPCTTNLPAPVCTCPVPNSCQPDQAHLD